MPSFRSPIICVSLILLASVSTAQVRIPGSGEATRLSRSVFGIGLAGGAASGIGLSFRHHLPSPVSYQLTGGVIKADENLYYDFGGEIQYDFILGAASRVFAAAAIGYYYSGTSDKNEIDAPGRAGLGIGGEFRLIENFHCSIEALFTYFTDGRILPLPQAGIFYYFL